MSQLVATYIIPACNMSQFEEEVTKLNRVAVKLGCNEITYAKSVYVTKFKFTDCEFEKLTFWVEDKNSPKVKNLVFTGVQMDWLKVELTGEKPMLAGWEFVGTLSPIDLEDGSVNLIKNVPGSKCPDEFRTKIGVCDHCKAIRRRKETFVVRKGDEYKSVGTQCLKDFAGFHADPHAVAKYAECLASLNSVASSFGDPDEIGNQLGGYERQFTLAHFLEIVSCAVRKLGWVSRARAKEDYSLEATADTAMFFMSPPRSMVNSAEYKELKKKLIFEDSDKTKAEDSIEWAKEVEFGDNDYLYNCSVIARSGVVEKKTAGIAASILVAYLKHMDMIEAQKSRPESNHVGTVGERIKVLELTCKRVITLESMYGTSGLHLLSDKSGNDLTWKASDSTEWMKEGETAFVAATVKDHGEYKGRKQTSLSRVKILSEEQVQKEIVKSQRS